MSSALVMTEMGLRVHRFASYAAAKAAMANIESDGCGALLREVICGWCGKPTGAAVLCDHVVDKPISDGMCSACLGSQLGGLDTELPIGDVASPLAPGTEPLGEERTAAPLKNAAMGNPTGSPAASPQFPRRAA